jgi:hypothetical protein
LKNKTIKLPGKIFEEKYDKLFLNYQKSKKLNKNEKKEEVKEEAEMSAERRFVIDSVF